MGKIRKVITVILTVLIILTVCYIWSNSFKGKAESSTESNSVYDEVVEVTTEVVGEEKAEQIFEVVTHKVFRKMAHAGEFALLGLECFFLLLTIKKVDFLTTVKTLCIGLSVGSIDEIIQIFSKRGPAVTDVLIDFSGFFLAIMICLGIYSIIVAVKRKKTKKSKKNI